MIAGRPTKYKPEFCEEVDKYLKKSRDEHYQLLRGSSTNGETYENKIRVKLPTLEGFASFIGIGLSTVEEWKRKYPIFQRAFEKIMVEQKKRLIDSGLSNDYNSTIAKLILASNHGMRDRTDVTSGDAPIKQVTGMIIQKDNADSIQDKE